MAGAAAGLLFATRSRLALAIERYYRAVIERLDATPWSRKGEPVRISRVAIPARVLRKDAFLPRWDPREDGGGRIADLRWQVDPEVARLYEVPADMRRERLRWEAERRSLRRAVIMGAPGGGKTHLAQSTCLALAGQGLEALETRSSPLDDLPLPVCLDLAGVARSGLPRGLLDALIVLIEDHFGANPALEPWLRRKLPVDAWLLLDALDQVSDDDRIRLRERLESIAVNQWTCRVALTCRTANYDRAKIPWRGVTEYELSPFNPVEVRRFVTRWYGVAEPREARLGARLNEVIGRNHSLAQACRTPLVATLACLANEAKELTEGTRRGDLYSQVLLDLLRQAYNRTPCEPQDPRVHARMEVLPGMAWKLFQASPTVNQFSHARLLAALREPAAALSLPPDALRDSLVSDGVLVPAGLNERNELQFSFVHRTFDEFLAAVHLGRVVNGEGWDKAAVAYGGSEVPVRLLLDKKAWLPEWQEVIALLPWALDDPAPLLLTVLAEGRDDRYRHRLALAMRCLGELGHGRSRELPAAIDRITAAGWEVFWHHLGWREMELVDPVAQEAPCLARAGGTIEPGVTVLERIAWMLRDPGSPTNEDVKRRTKAAQAAAALGNEGAAPGIVEGLLAMLQAYDSGESLVAAEALGALAGAAAGLGVPERLAAELPTGEAAGVALGRMAAAGVLDAKVTRQLLEMAELGHRCALRILGSMGAAAGPDVIGPLLKISGDPYEGVRRWAVEALGSIGETAAIPDVLDRLRVVLHDDHRDVALRAVEALGAMGPPAGRPDIIDGIRSREGDFEVVDALSRMGPAAFGPELLDRLARLFDEPSRGWEQACEAVARMGAAAFRQDILDRLLGLMANPALFGNEMGRAILCMGGVAATPAMIDRLLEMLGKKTKATWRAVEVLQGMRFAAGPREVGRVRELAAAANPQVAANALEVLAAWGLATPPPDFDGLFEAMKHSNDSAAWFRLRELMAAGWRIFDMPDGSYVGRRTADLARLPDD